MAQGRQATAGRGILPEFVMSEQSVVSVMSSKVTTRSPGGMQARCSAEQGFLRDPGGKCAPLADGMYQNVQ